MTTATATYGRFHDALLSIAHEHGLVPFDVRMLVALHERGGEGRSDELERDMVVEGSAIRRSSLTLRKARLVTADAGHGTRRPKRGVRARYELTPAGRAIAVRVLDQAADREADDA